MLDSPQVAALAAVETVAHPSAGGYRTVGPPLRLDGVRPALGPAPALGADTRAVLASVGIDGATVDAWVSEGWAVAP